MKKNTLFLLFTVICLLSNTLADAQVNISFTGGTGLIINKNLFGANMSANVPRLNYGTVPAYPNSGHNTDPWSADETFKPQYFPTTIADIGVTSLRYPGGHKTSFWHWDDIWYIPYVDLWGTYANDGGVSTRTTRKQASQYGGNMDIDEYMTQCINLNLEPMIGCNLLAGSRFGKYSTLAPSAYAGLPYGGDPVAETVAMLKYCKLTYPTKPVNYIFLDNEIGQGTANGTSTADHVSDAQYPQMIQDCSTAFKAESPTIYIITNLNDLPNTVNTKNLITSKGQYIDLVDTHFYYSTGNWLEYTRSAWMAQTTENLGGYPAQIRQFYTNCAAAGHSDIKLAVNEWNLLSVGPLLTDATTGAKTYSANDFDQMLVLSDMLMMFVREKVQMASLWSLYYSTNTASMIIPQQNYNVRTPCLVFKLFKEIQGQSIQNITSSSTDMIVMSALQNAQSTTTGTTPKLILLLLSKNASASRSISVDLGCFKPKTVSGFSYVEDVTTVTDPNIMDGRYKTITLSPVTANGKVTVNCAGLSLTKLTIDLDMTPADVDPTINHAPVATNVTVSGNATVGQTLTGSYTYVDMEANAQGNSTFRWLRSSSSTFDGSATPISGATTKTYQIQNADTGKYIFFQVTPVALTGITTGSATINTTPFAGPVISTFVNDIKSNQSVKIFPNPVGNKLNIELANAENKTVVVELLSIDGKLLKKELIIAIENQCQISVSGLLQGVYLCRINNGTSVEIAKFTKYN